MVWPLPATNAADVPRMADAPYVSIGSSNTHNQTTTTTHEEFPFWGLAFRALAKFLNP